MQDTHEYTATSCDDDWYDDPVFWSMAERNTIFDLIEAINVAHLAPGQAYFLQIQQASDDGDRPAAIVLTAREDTGPHPFLLQHLADCICRLVRPARYFGADPDDEDLEIWSQVFQTPRVSAHEKLRIMSQIPVMGAELGRTDYGIAAALDELRGWGDEEFLRSA